MHLYCANTLVIYKEEEQPQQQLIQRKLVILEDGSGKQIVMMTACSTFSYIVSDNLVVMRASAFLADKSFRISCLPEKVKTCLLVIAVFTGEVYKGWFLGLSAVIMFASLSTS